MCVGGVFTKIRSIPHNTTPRDTNSATNVGAGVFKEVLVEKKQQKGRSKVEYCVSAAVKEEL